MGTRVSKGNTNTVMSKIKSTCVKGEEEACGRAFRRGRETRAERSNERLFLNNFSCRMLEGETGDPRGGFALVDRRVSWR